MDIKTYHTINILERLNAKNVPIVAPLVINLKWGTKFLNDTMVKKIGSEAQTIIQKYTMMTSIFSKQGFPLRGYSFEKLMTELKVDPYRDFGAGRDGGNRNHLGLDLYAPEGIPVISMADCLITQIFDFYQGTQCVCAKNDARIEETEEYLYGEILPIVKLGARIKKGDVIGKIKSRGTGTNTMLHFQWLYDGTVANGLDPLTIFKYIK
jgi:hypothetical protein